MIILQAPHELIQTTTVLPNPRDNDTTSLTLGMNLHRSMDGTVRTYIKSNDRYRLQYEIEMTRSKSLELEAFFDAYFNENIRLTDWDNNVYVVKLMTVPVSFSPIRKNEDVETKIEFEGTKING